VYDGGVEDGAELPLDGGVYEGAVLPVSLLGMVDRLVSTRSAGVLFCGGTERFTVFSLLFSLLIRISFW
jgi:hypothetical protein